MAIHAADGDVPGHEDFRRNGYIDTDEEYAAREKARCVFKATVMQSVCVVGAAFCLVAPIVSARHRQYADEMKIGTIFCFCMAALFKLVKMVAQ